VRGQTPVRLSILALAGVEEGRVRKGRLSGDGEEQRVNVGVGAGGVRWTEAVWKEAVWKEAVWKEAAPTEVAWTEVASKVRQKR
jgi:hypothetical protein